MKELNGVVIEVDRDTLIKALSQSMYCTLELHREYSLEKQLWRERLLVENKASGRSILMFSVEKVDKPALGPT